MITVCAVRVSDILTSLGSEEWPDWITSARKARLQRYVRAEDRDRGLAGDILSRRMISNSTGLAEAEIEVKRDAHEKPFLPSIDLFFNVSHSGNRVACATAPVPVGVDVEKIRPVPELEHIVDRYFSVEEREAILAPPVEERLARFFEFWTLKESYIKAVGKGLSIPLSSFSIRLNKDGFAELEGAEGRKWFLRMYPLSAEYKMAVCAAAPDLPTTVLDRIQESGDRS